MSAKLVISLIFFITSIIVVVVVKEKEKKDKEEKEYQKEPIKETPKYPPLSILDKESKMFRINSEFIKVDGQLLIPLGLVSDEKLKVIDLAEKTIYSNYLML